MTLTNHPSGTARASSADEIITRRIFEMLDGTGIHAGHHAIIARYKYADGSVVNGESGRIFPRVRKVSIPITERRFAKNEALDKEITSPDSAREVTGRHSNALFLLNNENVPVAIVTLSEDEMQNLRKGSGVNRVLSAIGKSNATTAIIKTNNKDAAKNLARMLNGFGDINVLDWFDGNGNSDAEKGGVVKDSAGVFYSRNKDEEFENGLSDSQVQDTFDKFIQLYKGAGDVKLRILGSSREFSGYNEARDKGARLDASYQTRQGILSINRRAFDNAERLHAALREELLVHKGLGFFSPEGRREIYEGIKQAVKDDKTGKLTKLWDRTVSDYTTQADAIGLVGEERNNLFAEEFLGKVAQSKVSALESGFSKLYLAVKRALVKLGLIKNSITLRELQDVVNNIGGHFKDGREAPKRNWVADVKSTSSKEDSRVNSDSLFSRHGKDDYKVSPVVSLWRSVAEKDGAFATPRTNEKDFEKAVKSVMVPINENVKQWHFERKENKIIPSEGYAAPSLIVYDENYNKLLTVFDVDSKQPFVEIGHEAVGLGNNLGSLYQAIAGWANNNKKVMRPDPRSLSNINMQRRSEQMISAMLKYDNSGMIEPDSTQFIGFLSDADYKNFKNYGKEAVAGKLDELKLEYWGSDKSPTTAREMTDARINNLALAAAAFAKRNAPKEFENAIADSKGNVRQRNSDGGVDILTNSTGRRSATLSGSHLLGVGYSTRQRSLLTLQSIFGGTLPKVVDEASLQRAGALQSIGQKETPNSHERAGVEYPRLAALAEKGDVPLYSIRNNDEETRSGGFSVSDIGKKIPFLKNRLLREAQTRSLPPTLQDSYERLGDKTLLEKAMREVKRQLTPAGLLPKPVFDLKIARDGEMNVTDTRAKHTLRGFYDAVENAYGKPYKDLNRATKVEINKMLRGASTAQLAPSLVTAIKVMREDIKRLSEIHVRQLADDVVTLRGEGKDAEAESKERLIDTISDNFDTYLNRSYRAFDDPKWPSKVPAVVYKDAVYFLASEYANGGAVTADHVAHAKIRATAILTEGTAFESMGAFISESKLGAKDLSIMKKRKDVPAPVRALLGEYEDAAVNYAKTVTKMSRLVYNHAFLVNMKEAAMSMGIIQEKPFEGSTKIAADASEAYAPLNGLYTTHDFKQALVDVMGKHSPNAVYDTIVAINGMVKMGKTVLSPTTAFRNFWSSLFFTVANGHFDYSHAAQSFRTLRVYFKDRGDQAVKDYMLKLRRLGVVYDSPYASEMMDLLKDSKLADWMERKEGWLAKGSKASLDFSQRFYSMGDDFYKIIGFENEKARLIKHRGMSEAQAEKEAAERIRNSYPTYSMIGKGVNTLRRFPLVGSFVSFPAEIIRTSYNLTMYLKDDIKTYGIKDPIVQQRLAGWALAAGLIPTISLASALLMGVDDDEEEASRAMAAKWEKNSMFLWLEKDEKGNRQKIDLSFLDPYGYWKRPITAVLQNQPLDKAVISGASDLLSPFFGWDIAAKAIGESAFNGKVEGGKVYNEADSAGGIALDIANHLRKAAQPGFATNIERFMYAGMDEKTKTGKPFKASEEAAALFGWRISTFDPKVALYYQSFEYQDNKSNAAKILSRVTSDVNAVSDEELRDAYEQSIRARKAAFDQMRKIVAAAKNSGMEDFALKIVLKKSGVSELDRGALVSGKTPTFTPSKTAMKTQIKKAAVLFDEEVQSEFKRRERYINSLRAKGNGLIDD